MESHSLFFLYFVNLLQFTTVGVTTYPSSVTKDHIVLYMSSCHKFCNIEIKI